MDASRVVDERLRKRAAFATSAGHAVCSVLVAVANFQAEPWRTDGGRSLAIAIVFTSHGLHLSRCL